MGMLRTVRSRDLRDDDRPAKPESPHTVISASLPCSLKKGVSNLSDEVGDLPEKKKTAVQNSSPHIERRKTASLNRRRAMPMSVHPSRSQTPIGCDLAAATYSKMVPECRQSVSISLGYELTTVGSYAVGIGALAESAASHHGVLVETCT